jgi:hypothetical protein
MSTLRTVQIFAFLGALAFALSASLASIAYACGVGSGGGGFC